MSVALLHCRGVQAEAAEDGWRLVLRRGAAMVAFWLVGVCGVTSFGRIA